MKMHAINPLVHPPKKSVQTLAENRGITEFLKYWRIEGLQNPSFGLVVFFPKQKLWFRKSNSNIWFSHEYLPQEIPPIRSATARMLADNRGFTELSLVITELINFFSRKKTKCS